MFGYSVEELQSMRISEYIAPESVPAAMENMRNGSEESVALIGIRKDGSRFHVEVRGKPIDYNGKQMRVIAIRDITERLRAERIQREAMEAIESANKAKSRFLATMSHEIRTPLNGIIGMTVALENSALAEEQRRHLSILATCGQALLHQVNGILDLAKIESGSMELDFAPIDLDSTVSDALSAHGESANKNGLYWIVEKRMESRNWVLADQMRLRQIIGNLAGNAVKFTQSGGVRLTISSEQREGKAHFAFCISDTGIGIAPDVQKNLFKPFVQADASMNRRYGGSGLGLAICKQLAELLGGSLALESQIGVGSTFRFFCSFDSTAIPRDPVRGKDKEKDWSPARNAIDQNLGLSVLVVEDDKINQEVAKIFLNRIGCEAAFAGSAPEALESLKQRKYDLILMDCQLPGKDGLELTNEIRAEEPRGARTPIIAMTANAIQGDREACLAAGMDDYITKPIDPANLLSTIKSVIERS
jgi:signal transduction histidine kinase/ActR/RegA family two-component response regulator